ncbi:MAG: AAA family ATPase, partial [Anaerolineae bacterium]|nr:AAA family ATPase [Anaerolineae bacterium]
MIKKTPPHALILTLLGEPSLTWQGQPLTAELISSKGQALLVYLAMAGRAYSRSALAGLLWGDLPEQRARGNLRTVLNKLRPYVGEYLTVTRQTIAFNPTAAYTLDVSEFEKLVTTPAQRSIGQLQTAIALYRGHFLDDFQIQHAPDFELWLMQERDRLQRAFSSALKQLISHHEQAGDLTAAIATGQRLLQHDPLHEATYRHLMQLYHLIGDQATALRLYQTCLEMLRDELGVEPSPLTGQVYHQILAAKSVALLPHPSPVVTPLVGRRDSWQHLQKAWHSAVNHRPGSVWLIGEAGIGKSRLAEEFSRWVSQQEAIAVTAHCYAAEGNLPYGPVAQWLRAKAIFATLPSLDVMTRTEITRLLPEIRGEQADLAPTNLLTEGWQRQSFFEALARAVLACRRPLLLVLDDLQWCDQDSLEWLHYLLRFDSQSPLLLLATLRPEEITPDHPLQTLRWQLGYSEAIREIELARLNVEETARLAASLISQPLPVESTTQLYHETEGNPLFVVELVRAGLAESSVDSQRLPPRLQAVIAARLKRLSPFGRKLAGMAAAAGRNFDVDLLKQISQADEETLVRGLEELWQQQIIREQGTGLYDFSHDKIREVAYTHLSPAQRQLSHRRIAAGLEQRYGRGPHAASNRIAAHYEQAGQFEAAVLAYREAATAAWTLSAREVLAYLTTSLELLKRLPATPQRDQLELDLLLERGATLMQAQGNADPGVAATFERARELLLKMDDLLQIGPVLWGLWS